MHRYCFKGFDISYTIIFSNKLNYFEAKGEVNWKEKGEITFSKEFRTEVCTYKTAEAEIKKLMEEFIEFEWQQFNLLSEDSEKTFKIKPN